MTATIGGILPKGKTQFTDGTGTPLAGGSVFFYIPATTTQIATYQDQALSVPNTNPVILDANGEAIIWGFGSYRQIVQDSLGNTIWDEVVSAAPVPVFGIDSGAANALVVSVDGIAGLYTGLTLIVIPAYSNTGNTTLALSGLTPVNVTIGTNPIPSGGIVAGVAAQFVYDGTNFQLVNSQIPPSSNSPGDIKAIAYATPDAGWDLCYGKTYSRSANAALFAKIGTAWGAGDGSTTFLGPDLRGRGLFGADAMGGAAANRLTSASLGGTGNVATGFAVVSGGAITSLGLTFPGSGYTTVPAVTLSGGGGTGGSVSALIANGVVTGLTIVAAGTGYTSAPTITIAPPTGSTTAILGVTGGNEAVQAHNHTITITDPEHDHPLYIGYVSSGAGGTAVQAYQPASETGGGIVSATSLASTGITATDADYGAGASQNLPPAAVINWVMYVG